MNLNKNCKITLVLIALAVQEIVINHLTSGGGDNTIWQIAAEVPEPGSILFLALGGLWIRKQNHKNRGQFKS